MTKKVGFDDNPLDIKGQITSADLYSKKIIFEEAKKFYQEFFKRIDRKDFNAAKRILSVIEDWELEYGENKISTLKNNSILVAYLAFKFGQTVGLTKKNLSNVYISGLVQNIGKVYMCEDDKSLAYEYYSSPLKQGDKGFNKIARALKLYPLKTREYLEEHTNLQSEIIDTAVNYHSVHSLLFKDGYSDAQKKVSQLDTILWFADSLSAVSFGSIIQLQREYRKGKQLSLIEGFELLKDQTEEQVPKFWKKASSATLMGVIFSMAMGIASPSKSSAANYTAQEVVEHTNEERENQEVDALAVSDKLTNAALDKANDMLAKDYWSHFGPDGVTPWQFMSNEGYRYVIAGENLAKGFSDVDKLNQAWLASPTHHENIINPKFSEIGVAVIDGKLGGRDVTLVVEMFGNRDSEGSVKGTVAVAKPTQTPSVNIFESFKNFIESIILKLTK
ncbi:CAP domain-containing protein [Candidatus Dojkabacteria bacterium]|jgi:uncharacterized protein YkwD|nr:CAP domain-containing protein [Candidatus Dojkabacteria bacterium]